MVSWHFCNSAWYTSLCACSATFSYSRLFRSSLSNAIVASFSSMVCWWAWRSSSFVNSRAWTRFVRSSIFASNPRRCLLGRAPWTPCPCLFGILQWHTWPQRLRGIYPSCFDDVWVQTNPRAMGGCLYVISSRHFTFIQALHRHINMLEAQTFSNVGLFKPVLLLAVYKHLNIPNAKLLGLPVVIRSIQQGRDLYLLFFF